MKRTKIVCTVGPSCDDVKILVDMINNGADVFRMNFAHGDKKERDNRIALIKEAWKITGKHVPILIDVKGPEIRTGYVEGYSEENKKATIELKKGSIISFICDYKSTQMDGPRSTPEKIYISYDNLAEDVQPGYKILLDDGNMVTEVLTIKEKEIIVKILNDGKISSKRGVNIPGAKIRLPALTEKDKTEIIYGIENDCDFIAMSFVRKAEDLIELKSYIDEHKGHNIKLISKIENQEGINNLDEIIALSDGIMVARGDMGVEIPIYKVPLVQKEMIRKALSQFKIVITATQMLDSMIKNPGPTRAEVSDVFNAVHDMSSCVMLSGETAYGTYPVESVTMMTNICREAEHSFNYWEAFKKINTDTSGHIATSVSFASITVGHKVNAKAIVIFSESGYTARMVSAMQPGIPIIGITTREKVARQMHILWGVKPVLKKVPKNADLMYEEAAKIAHELGYAERGDNIVVSLGTPIGVPGTVNTMKVITLGHPNARGIPYSHGTITGTVKFCRTVEEAAEKLKQGDIAVFYKFSHEYEKFIDIVGGIIISGQNYDDKILRKTKAKKLPVLVDMYGVEKKLTEYTFVELDATKGAVFNIEQ